MKKIFSYLFMALVAGLLIFFIANQTRKYTWSPTFQHTSDEPLDCALFDSLMSSTHAMGAEVMDDVPDSVDPRNIAILYVKYDLQEWEPTLDTEVIDSLEFVRAKKLMNLAKKGAIVVFSAGDFGYSYGSFVLTKPLELSFNENANNYYQYTRQLSDSIAARKKRQSQRCEVVWVPDSSKYKLENFMLIGRSLAKFEPNGKYDELAQYTYNGTIYDQNNQQVSTAITHNICYRRTFKNGGQFIYVATPLLFTNYAVMDGSTIELIMKVMEPTRDRHLVRIYGKNSSSYATNHKSSPKGLGINQFDYILSQPQLKWALRLAMIVLLIFCIFSARRKMRPIPATEEPANATLSFAKFVGTFYFNRKQHKTLVLKKYANLLKYLHSTYGWEVDKLSAHDLAIRIAEKTGLSDYLLERFINKVNYLNNENVRATQEDMMKMIDTMKEIKEKIT